MSVMNENQETCSICLQIDENARKITETNGYAQSAGWKLRSCVPEINWEDNFLICAICTVDLDCVYQFREKCLRSNSIRSQMKLTQHVKPEVQITEQNLSETSVEKSTVAHKFICDVCSQTFTTTKQLITHSVEEHCNPNLKPFACKLCNSRFGSSSNLAQHTKYHKGIRSHVCVFCGKGFITNNELKTHEKIHLNQREYKCEQCSKTFNTHKDLRTHKFVVHTDPSHWQHVCEICTRRFPVKSNFDAHMRRHRGERPFACHLCEKKFIDNSTLQKHVQSHSNIRSFMCDVCKKEYKDKRGLDIHKVRVHGIGDVKVPVREKRHFCHVCPKAYCEKNKLTRHLRQHTGEKPYFCKVCQKRFSDKSYVRPHMKKVHNIVENVDK